MVLAVIILGALVLFAVAYALGFLPDMIDALTDALDDWMAD